MKPRIAHNLLDPNHRFPTASVYGTGSKTETTENDGLNGLLKVESGALGRGFWTITMALAANQWYCFSFEVTQHSTALTSDNGFKFTVAPDTGDDIITGTNIIAGGNGRYACVFMDTTGGNFISRLGVGLNANATDAELTVKNLMWEKIDITKGAFPSEFVYPYFKAAYNSQLLSCIDTNHKVVESRGDSYTVDPGSVVLLMSDSRSDEETDVGAQLNIMLGHEGACHIHADAGWTTTSLLGPTTKKTSWSLTSAKAIAGTLLTRTFSGDGNYELYDLNDSNQVMPDVVVLMIGVNDISTSGTADNLTIDTAMDNIITICDEIVAAQKTPCLCDLTPFNAWASFSATSGDQIQAWVLNRRIKEYANAKGYIFVPLYAAMGDSTDADKLSDGADTSPDYSGDGLHLSTEGSRRVAAEIKAAIDLWRQ